MNHKNNKAAITSGKDQVIRNYNRLSLYYDCFAGIFEKGIVRKGMEYLRLEEGEKVLDIGTGTGRYLKNMARQVGISGEAHGIDISRGMTEIARKRITKSRLDNVSLHLGDAADLPFMPDEFDAVFMSFTLELFDNSEIPSILGEIKRVLKQNGRFGIVCLSKEGKNTIPIIIYEKLYNLFRHIGHPVRVEKLIKDDGFEISRTERHNLFGLPVTICIGKKPDAVN